jgi:pimeloyl-ACP methyl ester carboxylesterase
MSSTVTSKDGTIIVYDKIGTGPAVILLDSAGCFRGFGPMEALAAQLASSGRGESTDTLPYAVDREVEDLGALIQAVGGSAFVHGFSSGGILGLYAALHGFSIRKLSMLEPPLSVTEPSTEEKFRADLAEFIAAGQRSEAVEYFNTNIGVPPEIIADFKKSPHWALMEGLAHTLVYDATITGTFPVDQIPAIKTPALVVASEASDHRLLGWAQGLAEALPGGKLRTLPGEWHGVAPEVLAPALTEFFNS